MIKTLIMSRYAYVRLRLDHNQCSILSMFIIRFCLHIRNKKAIVVLCMQYVIWYQKGIVGLGQFDTNSLCKLTDPLTIIPPKKC